MVIKVAHTSVTHMPRSREAAERLLMGSCSALRVFVIGIEVIELATDAWKGTRIFQFYLGGTSRTYQIFSYFGPIRRELPSNTNVIYVTICSAINYVTERECARSSDN